MSKVYAPVITINLGESEPPKQPPEVGKYYVVAFEYKVGLERKKTTKTHK